MATATPPLPRPGSPPPAPPPPATVASLARPTWRSYLRAVLAIARKDVIVFFRYPLNALFRIVEPVVWLTPVFLLGRAFGGPANSAGFAAYAGTTDFISFVVLGALLSNYVFAVFWGMGFALKNEMDAGVLESNWLTPLPRPLFLLGQTVASLAVTTLNGAAMLALTWVLFGVRFGGDLLAALATLLPVLIALYGFGFAFAGLVLLLREANTLVDVSNFLLTLLCGASFPVQALPRHLLVLSLALPLTYGYDAVRAHLLGTKTLLPLPWEVAILLGFMLVMAPLGYAVFRRIERRCRAQGTLWLH